MSPFWPSLPFPYNPVELGEITQVLGTTRTITQNKIIKCSANLLVAATARRLHPAIGGQQFSKMYFAQLRTLGVELQKTQTTLRLVAVIRSSNKTRSQRLHLDLIPMFCFRKKYQIQLMVLFRTKCRVHIAMYFFASRRSRLVTAQKEC